MAGFATEEIEDGHGLTTALVYDDIAAAKTYLDARGLTAFGLKSDADQKAALLRATETAEDAIRPHVEGRNIPISEGQGLIFPALGAYNSAGQLIEGIRPDLYRKGIFLLAAEVAAGTFMPRAKRDPTIASQSSGRGSMTYRAGAVPSSIASNHPDAWKKIATAIPQL